MRTVTKLVIALDIILVSLGGAYLYQNRPRLVESFFDLDDDVGVVVADAPMHGDLLHFADGCSRSLYAIIDIRDDSKTRGRIFIVTRRSIRGGGHRLLGAGSGEEAAVVSALERWLRDTRAYMAGQTTSRSPTYSHRSAELRKMENVASRLQFWHVQRETGN